MSFKNVQTALDSKLNSLPGSDLDVAWEGTNYEIVNGTAFIRPTNLTAVSDQLDLSNESQNNVGIYQIDVFYPLTGRGTGPILDTISDIFNHFLVLLR